MLENAQQYTEQSTLLERLRKLDHLTPTFKTKMGRFSFQISLIGWIALIYLGMITLAELFTTLFAPLVGVALHGLILLSLLIHAALSERISTRRFLLALSLAPLSRLLSMMMPLQHFFLIYSYILVGGPLYLAAINVARVGQVSRKMLGITGRQISFQILVSLSGIGLGYLEYKILRPTPLVTGLRLEQVWLPALILLVFTGLLEEFIFRGLLQSAATASLGRAGIGYMAAVFAVLHLGYHSGLDLIFVFVVALFFGWVVQHTGSILGVTLAHGLTNIGMFLIFPFLLAPAQVVPTLLPDHSRPGLSQPLFILESQACIRALVPTRWPTVLDCLTSLHPLPVGMIGPIPVNYPDQPEIPQPVRQPQFSARVTERFPVFHSFTNFETGGETLKSVTKFV